MEAGSSRSRCEPNDGQLTSAQVEMLELLRRLVHLTTIGFRNLQEVREKVPVKGKRI